MKTATALALVAVGAILAFAVTAQPSFFSFHVAGWVLMLTGTPGTVIPRRGYGWMRRKLVLSTGTSRRKELDIRQRRYSRLLVPGGILGKAARKRRCRRSRLRWRARRSRSTSRSNGAELREPRGSARWG